MPMFDLTAENHRRVCLMPGIANEPLEQLLMELGFMISFSHAFKTGEFRRIKIEVGEQSIQSAMKDLLGNQYEWSLLKYNVIYPRKEWEL